MKRLNEYTAHELQSLELIIALAGEAQRVLSNDKMKTLPTVKFWAEQVAEAKKDVEMENELLPFGYKPEK